MTQELKVDKHRMLYPPTRPTGILVRAKVGDKWESVDIVILERRSLLAWLRSRGGKNEWAENTVGVLLGHSEPLTGGCADG